MRRWLTPLALTMACVMPLRADVRVTSSTTVEGAAAGMMGGTSPQVVMHIKGMKARADVDMGAKTVSTITDVAAKQFILLSAAEKTAHIMTPGVKPPEGALPAVMPTVDATVAPTGKSQTIAGVPCEEFTIAMSMSMAEMAGREMPPEAAGMMKGIRIAMNGSMWVAKSGPGAAEYIAFQTASAKENLAALMGMVPGMRSSGLDRLMNAFAKAGGLPYLTELAMTIEGNDQIAALMKQQGPIKVITKVTDVSTDPISDDLFKVPEGYKIIQ